MAVIAGCAVGSSGGRGEVTATRPSPAARTTPDPTTTLAGVDVSPGCRLENAPDDQPWRRSGEQAKRRHQHHQVMDEQRPLDQVDG